MTTSEIIRSVSMMLILAENEKDAAAAIRAVNRIGELLNKMAMEAQSWPKN